MTITPSSSDISRQPQAAGAATLDVVTGVDKALSKLKSGRVSLVERLRSKQRTELLASTRVWVIAGEKGGTGKSTVAEALAILLDDKNITHSIAECETDARLGKRLGERVVHHKLHEADAKALSEDPDLLNQYWDRVADQFARGAIIIDLAANALALMMSWSNAGTTREALNFGKSMDFALVTTSDHSSLSSTMNSARMIQHVLPHARIWLLFNPLQGAVDEKHEGIRAWLSKTPHYSRITLPVCRAVNWGTLKNIGRFDEVATMSAADLRRHGISALQAGRSLQDVGEWLLAMCGAIEPMTAPPRQ